MLPHDYFPKDQSSIVSNKSALITYLLAICCDVEAGSKVARGKQRVGQYCDKFASLIQRINIIDQESRLLYALTRRVWQIHRSVYLLVGEKGRERVSAYE